MMLMKKMVQGFLCASILTGGVAIAEDLLGAGATFPYPLYSQMFSEYKKSTNVAVNYQSIGSGGGVRQIINKTVDFGATDGFLTDKELAQSSAPLVHIPMCLGAVAVTYNLPKNPTVNFSQDVLADIFLGKITQWNDPRLQAINPDVKLPVADIVVVHRSDGSGTTAIFVDFLSKISEEWKTTVGEGKSVNWPVGLGGKGNEGVSGLVKQVPGSIGYVELVYALQNNMPQANVANKSGNYVKPTVLCTALAGDVPLPDDTRVSLTNTAAANGYPIAGFTWIVVYKEQSYSGRKKEKAQKLVDLLWWMIHEGQQYAEPLHYVPLSEKAKQKAEAVVKSITYQGATLKQ